MKGCGREKEGPRLTLDVQVGGRHGHSVRWGALRAGPALGSRARGRKAVALVFNMFSFR